MTAGELIVKLQDYDPNMEVAVEYFDNEMGTVCVSIHEVVKAAGHYLSDAEHIELMT